MVFIQRTDILNSGNVPLALSFGRVVTGPDSGNIGGLLAETSTPGGISVRQLYNLEQNAFKATVKECYEEGYLRTKAYSDGILEMLNRD